MTENLFRCIAVHVAVVHVDPLAAAVTVTRKDDGELDVRHFCSVFLSLMKVPRFMLLHSQF